MSGQEASLDLTSRYMCSPGTANSKPAALDFMMASYECNSECSTDGGHAYRLRVFLQPAKNAICAHVGPYGQYAYWWPQPKPQALKRSAPARI